MLKYCIKKVCRYNKFSNKKTTNKNNAMLFMSYDTAKDGVDL